MADAHTQFFGGIQRDMVVPDAAAGQVFYAHPGPGFQVFGPNRAGVRADGVAAFGQVQVLRRGYAGRAGIVDAVLLFVRLAILLLVKGAQCVKHDLHVLSSSLQVIVEEVGQPVRTQVHPGAVVGVGGVDLPRAGTGAVAIVVEEMQLKRHFMLGQGRRQQQ